MKHIGRAVVVGAVLLAASSGWAAPRPWVEVKSPGFTVVSDADERRARDVAWQFEQARAAYGQLWSWGRVKGGKPFVVLAARDEASLKALAPQYWERKGDVGIASVDASGWDRHYLALRLDVDTSDDVRASPYFTLYRAYVTTALGAAFDRPLPLWLRKGFSEVYGNTRVKEKEVWVGRVVPWHVRKLGESRRIPLAQFLAAERGSPLLAGDNTYLFSAQSWALVHYLVFGDKGAMGPRLARFVDLLQQGRPQDQAIVEVFGGVVALEKGLDLYLHQVGLPYSRVDVDVNVARERFPVRSLTPAEAAAVHASFQVAMHRPKEARILVDQAKGADPGLAAAYDAEALLLQFEQAGAPALAAYQKAAELGSSSFYTHYRLAQLLHGAAKGKEDFARVATHLERGVDLNPNYASGHSFLAEVKSYLGEPERGLVMAKTAIALEPGGSYHHSAMANVLLDLRRPEEAMAAAQRSLALADDDWDRGNAQRTIEEIKRKGASGSEPAPGQPTAVASPASSPPPSEAVSGGDVRVADRGPARNAGRTGPCLKGDGAACVALLPVLEKECAGGQGPSCGDLARIYDQGKGVPLDLPVATALYTKACEAGDRRSCARGAYLTAVGNRRAGDEERGLAALERLCAADDWEACSNLQTVLRMRQDEQGIARIRTKLDQACKAGVIVCSSVGPDK
jgi:tetratricopeptide (TPR) repeat protein